MDNGQRIKKSFSASTLAIAIVTIISATTAYAETVELSNADSDVELAPTVLFGEKDRYQEGKDNQFDKNIVNIYQDKDDIEHFKGQNPTDLLNGVPGVYSSDGRNSGGLTPNIRGIQGEGRVPVVIDGTQSEFTIYRGYAGVNNRSYIDPNLLSEVTVYKGATELGMPTGIAGAVVANTIDAKDVIPEGKNWGINLRYETNNNSVKPNIPNLPYGESALTTENWWAMTGDANPHLYVPLRNSGKDKFFQDGSFRIAVAAKNDVADLMMAYSYRDQGNYFSGKRGAGDYQSTWEEMLRYNPDNTVIPIAAYYPPGYEANNTSSRNASFLVKNNWYLPHNQELNLSWRLTNLNYGEVMASRASYAAWANQYVNYTGIVGVQFPLAKVDQTAGRFDYKFNPDDNNWLNLKAGLWYSNTHSENNSSGAPILAPHYVSQRLVTNILQRYDLDTTDFPEFKGCIVGERDAQKFDPNCQIPQGYFDKVLETLGLNNEKGYFTLYNPALIVTQNSRWGADISNVFKLTSNLNLTVGANLQKEKLDGHNEDVPKECSVSTSSVSEIEEGRCGWKATFLFGGKKGEREEINSWFNFDWQATDKLNISVGGRYGRYWSFDNQAAAKIKESGAKFKTLFEADIKNRGYDAALENIRSTVWNTKGWNHKNPTVKQTYEVLLPYDKDDEKLKAIMKEKGFTRIVFRRERYDYGGYFASLGYDGGVKSIQTDEIVEIIHDPNDGKDYPQYKYITAAVRSQNWLPNADGKFDRNTNGGTLDDSVLKEVELYPGHTVKEVKNKWGSVEGIPLSKEDPEAYAKMVYAPIEKHRANAFDPSIAVTYKFTDFNRIYARYIEQTRFPSLYEDTIGFSEGGTISAPLKPEQAKNLEIGFVQDFRQWLPSLKNADLKVNYYHNQIKDVIDRATLLSNSTDRTFFSQYDSLKTSGIELQARWDTGKIFGNLGYSYLIDSKMCDADWAAANDPFNTQHYPECWLGGIPGGYLRGAIPPKQAVTLGLGTRLLNDNLTLGVRGTYNSMSNLKKQKAEGFVRQGEDINTYGWKSYWVADAYLDWQINQNFKASLVGTNLTNMYYPDALYRSITPAPGRTFKLALDMKF